MGVCEVNQKPVVYDENKEQLQLNYDKKEIRIQLNALSKVCLLILQCEKRKGTNNLSV